MRPKLELECAIGAIKNIMEGRAKTIYIYIYIYSFEKQELKAAQQINKKEQTHLSIHLALGDPFDQSTSMPAAPLDPPVDTTHRPLRRRILLHRDIALSCFSRCDAIVIQCSEISSLIGGVSSVLAPCSKPINAHSLQ